MATQMNNGILAGEDPNITNRTTTYVPSPPGAEKKTPRAAAWTNRGYTSMAVTLGHVPPETTTLDIYASFAPLSVISIDILENSLADRSGFVRVRLVPPTVDYWYDRAWRLQIQGPPQRSVLVSAMINPRDFRGLFEDSIKTPLHRWVPAQTDIRLSMVGQGFMHQKRTMMVMDEVNRDHDVKIGLKVNFSRREFSIFVTRYLEQPLPYRAPPDANGAAAPPPRMRRLQVEYRIDIRFSWIKNIWQQTFPGGRGCIVIALDSPPEYWRKMTDATKTHGSDHISWHGIEQWVRMAFLTMNLRAVRDATVSLNGSFPQGQSVDLGRWTTFRLGLEQINAGEWEEVVESLCDYDLRVKKSPEFQFLRRDDRNMWDCVQPNMSPGVSALTPAPSSNMHHLSRSLSFDVAYQLEVCISRNFLHESTLDVVFLESLAALVPDRATRMLEYVAEHGKRIYRPHDIFRDPKAASYWRKSPADAFLDKNRAVYVRKAIVTPTTIIYSTPALEAGNRVLRHYREHHDRFLRVQFTDELLIGRLSGGRDSKRTDECFSRAFRALKNGIRVGGRHFEFLAFGNSQLRENSTFFFAPTDLLSCQDIRDWMGDFTSIKTVAKYAARLGQCLSTTRPVPTFGVPTTVQPIPDVENGHFCFTDGVGKISKWWARVIANHFRLDQVPSAVQFRMGGCKGILVVWPDVSSGQIVQIRPSQEKFAATAESASILEIVRYSETATATLNQQIIILLTALGVPPTVFLELLTEELVGLDAVMSSPRKAVAQLMGRIDQNHVTPVIADLVKAGFMASDEPFVWALLQLWRSWTLKALKEKARITVEKSAFVFGCVDETGTLRGHVQKTNKKPENGDEEEATDGETDGLPQIFLQVPDFENGLDGIAATSSGNNSVANGATKYKIITGLCLIGRNPSLHPGDLRVVEAVDVPVLHHLRDVVVFPRKGDRDIPSMCSGGDLDGDDYFVFWDERLLPPSASRNYEAMNYDAIREPDVDQVTTRHLISFFVQHIKHDTLPRIALAHRAYADQLEGGALNPRCLELAQLHSQAVDYAKTGVPALMPHRLSPREWPHWMGRSSRKTYRSYTALGRIYDEVQVGTFEPVYDKPFDKRILEHYPSLDVDLLRRARRIKTQYDLAVRRSMAQRDIDSEFEMWSGFTMRRPRVGSDYKVAEDIGRLFKVITARFRRVCLREVGNSHDIVHLGPFVAAMYTVTYEEVRIALHEFTLSCYRNTLSKAEAREHCVESRFTHQMAPLISFPWLFSHELSSIALAHDATPKDDGYAAAPAGDDAYGSVPTESTRRAAEEGKKDTSHLLTQEELYKMEYTVQNGVSTHRGIPLDIAAFSSPREEEDEYKEGDAGFQPVWTLAQGKTESDVVIDLVASTKSQEDQIGEYDDTDYDFLTTRIGPRTNAGQTRTKEPLEQKNGTSMFPWAEIEDDILSSSSEDGLNQGPQKIVIKRDDDDEEDKQGAANTMNEDKGNNYAEGSTRLRGKERVARRSLDRTAAELTFGHEDTDSTVADGELVLAQDNVTDNAADDAADDADDEDEDNDEDNEDVFVTVNNLFRDPLAVTGGIGKDTKRRVGGRDHGRRVTGRTDEPMPASDLVQLQTTDGLRKKTGPMTASVLMLQSLDV